MIKIKYAGRYQQNRQKLKLIYPELGKTINKRILWFRKNPNDQRLHNHELHGSMEGKCAFSISDDIRIIYKWSGKNIASFLDIGRHAQVYQKR